MNSNLKICTGFKDLLLKKLSYAVTCSVLSHMTVIILYIVVINFSFQPYEWFRLTYNTLTSFSTWFYLTSFTSIVLAQMVICAKDYVVESAHAMSRFQKFISIFSFRTFTLCFLHVVIGGVAVWLYLSLCHTQFEDLYVKCQESSYCLVKSTVFLILSGIWTGFYFFLRLYVPNKNPIFPVVQQYKLLNFKANFLSLVKDSKSLAFYPTITYFIFYYFCGDYFYKLIAYSLKLRLNNESFNYLLCLYVWFFTVMYIFNMNLMKFFFELYLTEPIEHPIVAVHQNDATLSEALLLNNMPILQHLACLDLYMLSMWSPERRRALFTLSQPGGHPHTWNHLIQGGLKLMSDFTATLNRSTAMLLNKDEVSTKSVEQPRPRPVVPLERLRRTNIRNMSLIDQPTDEFEVYQQMLIGKSDKTESDAKAKLIGALKNIRLIKYVFGELPEAQIKHCLKNGQLIVWTTQGLTNIAVASINEDPYGIVQKDLSALITCLVELKQSIEKLNKLPAFSKKGLDFDCFSFNMKNSLNSACKRGLFNLCRTFGNYLNDIPLSPDIFSQLHCYRL